MNDSYAQNGYLLKKGRFVADELVAVREILQRFHAGWLNRNREFYENRGAINSAYLTDPRYMSAQDRGVMFKLISSSKIQSLLAPIMPNGVAFMNTQLFFGPANSSKKNYWHRDIQYSGMSLTDQQSELAATNVIHCRIALVDEPGIELVPGTHERWDTEQEFEIRTEKNGRHVYDDLPGAHKLKLKAGDLLVFSANMIHRGLYAPDRLALDILYCDPVPSLLEYCKETCLPNAQELKRLDPVSPLAVTAMEMAKLVQRRIKD